MGHPYFKWDVLHHSEHRTPPNLPFVSVWGVFDQVDPTSKVFLALMKSARKKQALRMGHLLSVSYDQGQIGMPLSVE